MCTIGVFKTYMYMYYDTCALAVQQDIITLYVYHNVEQSDSCALFMCINYLYSNFPIVHSKNRMRL